MRTLSSHAVAAALACISLFVSMPACAQAWPESTPEAQGMSSKALAELVDFGGANAMDSLVVTRNGTLVAEAYYAPFRPGMIHRINSATKAVVGMLTGIAIAEGKISGPNAPVMEFFSERTIANLDANKKAITLQHLLDQTSGIAWDEFLSGRVPQSLIELERSANWVQYVLDKPMAQPPGEGFNYNSGNSQLISAIVTKQVGMSLPLYATAKVFGPMGISDFKWRTDPQGIATGGFGMYMQTRDMAKLGYLYLRGGKWEGAQLVPAAWVARAFAPTVPMKISATTDFRYADQWWAIPALDAYIATGFNRQLIVVMPKTGVVLATTGRRNYDIVKMITLARQAVGETAVAAADNEGLDLMRARIAAAAVEKPAPVPAVLGMAAQVSGKTFTLAPNLIGATSFSLDLSAGTYSVTLLSRRGSTETRTVTQPMGMNGLYSPAVVPAPATGTTISRASWEAPDTFVIWERRLEEGDVFRYALKFSGDTVAIDYSMNNGFEAKLTGKLAN